MQDYNYTDALINDLNIDDTADAKVAGDQEPIDQEAVAQYQKALKQEYLDIPAWKQAYWKRVEAANMQHIFTNSGLIRAGSWQKIKTVKDIDPELYAGLVSLYRAYFFNKLRTPEGKENRELRNQKAREKYTQEIIEENKLALERNQKYCDEANKIGHEASTTKYPDLVKEFEETTKQKVEDAVKVAAVIPLQSPLFKSTTWYDVLVCGINDFGDGHLTARMDDMPSNSKWWPEELARAIRRYLDAIKAGKQLKTEIEEEDELARYCGRKDCGYGVTWKYTD